MGIDPGLATYGWCLSDQGEGLLYVPQKAGFYCTKKRQGISPSADFMARSNQLTDWVWELLSEHEPDFVVAEAFSYPRHARSAVMLAAGYTVTLTACRMLQIPFLQINRTVVLDHYEIDRKARGARQRKKLIKDGIMAKVDELWPGLEGLPRAKAKREHPADAVVSIQCAVALENFLLRLETARVNNDVVLVE